MFLKRYYLGCLAHASYMIADEKTKTAVVVDPQRDVDQYLADAKQHGFEIKYVFLTHFHADFIAGHIELKDQAGAKIYLSSKSQAEYDYTPFGEGDSLQFGDVRLAALDTPGHTPDSISILVYDLKKHAEKPYAVLTGDALFIGDVGRPDLLASIGFTADQLGDMLYDSMHSKLLRLPDETLVYPAHGAGSLCGKKLSNEAVSTIGEQKKFNYALQPMSKDEFKRIVTADQPDAPDYFVHDAILNRKVRESLSETIKRALQPLTLEQVIAAQNKVTQVVDVRGEADFAGAHLTGSINVPLDGKYATWAGTVISKDRPIILIADRDHVEEAIMRLGRIGFDNVSGYLDGGMLALANRPELIAQTSRVTAVAAHNLIRDRDDVQVIDVRAESEWNAGHIADSKNVPLSQLQDRLDEISSTGTVIVHCQGGYRSSIAASILQQQGRTNVLDLVGGFAAWKGASLPVAAKVAANV